MSHPAISHVAVYLKAPPAVQHFLLILMQAAPPVLLHPVHLVLPQVFHQAINLQVLLLNVHPAVQNHILPPTFPAVFLVLPLQKAVNAALLQLPHCHVLA